jgi:hypothetical protein
MAAASTFSEKVDGVDSGALALGSDGVLSASAVAGLSVGPGVGLAVGSEGVLSGARASSSGGPGSAGACC